MQVYIYTLYTNMGVHTYQNRLAHKYKHTDLHLYTPWWYRATYISLDSLLGIVPSDIGGTVLVII